MNELKAQMKQKSQLEESNRLRLVDQKDELVKILIRKDRTIDHMSSELTGLEKQLQSAVSEKLNAFARLEKIEGKELTLAFKEKRMDFDAQLLNNNIEYVTDDLNKTKIELTAVQQELSTASAQFKIDLAEMSEQLRTANSNVHELRQMNEMLEIQNEEGVFKLNDQLNESSQLIESYENDLKAKTDLAELYKGYRDDYEAQIDELSNAVTELQKLLYDTVDDCGIRETKLIESELLRQTESAAKDEIITKLKQELKDANCLLKANEKSDDYDIGKDKEVVNDFPLSENHSLKPGVTFTEMYTRYCIVVKELQNKEQENRMLEVAMNEVVEDVKEKAIDFDQQRNELQELKAANDVFIEERNDFLVETVVGREELGNSRVQCELLKDENNKLKFFESEYSKKFISKPSNELATVKVEIPVIERTSNTHELEHQIQELLALVNDLIATKIQNTDMIENLKNENYELRAHKAVSSSTANVYHKSVEVTEDDLMLEGNLHSVDIPSQKSRKENLLKIEELTQDNCKLRNDVLELTAKKNVILAESNLSNVKNSIRIDQIDELKEQNRKYDSTITEHTIANKYLKDENVNTKMKLSVAESRFEDLRNKHQLLSNTKASLVIEVETLKRELIQEKVANKILKTNLEMMKELAERSKTETLMGIDYANGPTERISNADDHSDIDIEGIEPEILNKALTLTVPTDNGIGNHEQRSPDFAGFVTSKEDLSQKKTFLQMLQLTKSKSHKALAEAPLSTSSLQVDSLKRSMTAQNGGESSFVKPHATNYRERLRPRKRARVSFVDLSECSDNETEMQLLSEVRTRKQVQFIHEAFHG